MKTLLILMILAASALADEKKPKAEETLTLREIPRRDISGDADTTTATLKPSDVGGGSGRPGELSAEDRAAVLALQVAAFEKLREAMQAQLEQARAELRSYRMADAARRAEAEFNGENAKILDAAAKLTEKYKAAGWQLTPKLEWEEKKPQ